MKFAARLIFALTAFGVMGLTIMEACKQTAPPSPWHYGASVNPAISYQVGSGATINLPSNQNTQVPLGASLTINTQSNTNAQKVTYVVDCPGYLVSPQTYVIYTNDGGNSTAITFNAPNFTGGRCTVTTTSTDGYQYTSYTTNTFSVGPYGAIEVPITGVVSTDAASLTATSNSNLPVGTIVTRSYFAPLTLWDAGCTIQIGQPVDGGNNALFGYFDAGTTLQAVGTTAQVAYRAYNEAGTAMPIQVNLAPACEGGTGVVGVEFASPSN
jgi:hypothetical protein